MPLRGFSEIVVVDSEFETALGERPVPVCIVGRELRSGRRFRLFQGQFDEKPPWADGDDVLFVAYANAAEFGVYHVLGWPLPAHTIDLFVEFRWLTNGRTLPLGAGLLGALAYFNLPGMDAVAKKLFQTRIGSGEWRKHYTPLQVLDYCDGDVDEETALLLAMLPFIKLDDALWRGRYIKALSFVQDTGPPIDTALHGITMRHWEDIKLSLIASVDAAFVHETVDDRGQRVRHGIYDGATFRSDWFRGWLAQAEIPWPTDANGRLLLDKDTFRSMAKSYPAQIAVLADLRYAISQLQLKEIAIGRDGRNRVQLKPFASRTGRNQPSTSEYIFGNAIWTRGYIKSERGMAFALVDWSAQEIGVGADLSGDRAYIEDYLSGDPYLAFARSAGAVPEGATKKSHPKERSLYKTTGLAVNYGQEAYSLSLRINQPQYKARQLLREHRGSYRGFWRWSDAVHDTIMLKGALTLRLGWRILRDDAPLREPDAGRRPVVDRANPRSMRNFAVQGNSGELMRVGLVLMIERGLPVVGVIHDAYALYAPAEEIDAVVAAARACMDEACRVVLNGLTLRSDATVVKYPNRYRDKDRGGFWDDLMERLMVAVIDAHYSNVTAADVVEDAA